MCVLIGISFSARFISPLKLPFFQFFPFLLFPLTVITGVFFLIRFFKKNRWLVSFLFFVFLLADLNNSYRLRTIKDVGRKNSLSVLNYNVEQFRGDTSFIRKTREYLVLWKPDVVCLQEYGYKAGRFNDSITQLFATVLKTPFYHFWHHKDNTFGVAIFSKFPIIGSDTIYQPVTINNAAAYVDLKVEKQTIRIVNFHLFSYNLKSAQQKRYRDVLGDIPLMFKKVMTSYQNQAKHLDKVISKAEGAKGSVVLAGDLNNISGSYFYHRLSSDYQDSFTEAGKGSGITFPIFKWGVRIDYQFSLKDLKVLDHDVFKTGLSDHYAVLVKYQLPD